MSTDYNDICLLHGVRTNTEFQARYGVLSAMVKLKEEGKVRGVGLSSHGLSTLKAVLKMPEMDLVCGRINYAGINMETDCLTIYDQMASIYWLKKCVKLLPEMVLRYIRPKAKVHPIQEDAHQEGGETLQKIYSQSKGIVGMKVLEEGVLRNDAEREVKLCK